MKECGTECSRSKLHFENTNFTFPSENVFSAIKSQTGQTNCNIWQQLLSFMSYVASAAQQNLVDLF
jgi:hypothetical protein